MTGLRPIIPRRGCSRPVLDEQNFTGIDYLRRRTEVGRKSAGRLSCLLPKNLFGRRRHQHIRKCPKFFERPRSDIHNSVDTGEKLFKPKLGTKNSRSLELSLREFYNAAVSGTAGNGSTDIEDIQTRPVVSLRNLSGIAVTFLTAKESSIEI